MKSQRKILQIELIAKTVFSVLYEGLKAPTGKTSEEKEEKEEDKGQMHAKERKESYSDTCYCFR